MPNAHRTSRRWQAVPIADALTELQTGGQGLSAAEVERRQREYGPNTLPEQGAPPLWQVLLRQFASPLIYVLVAAAVVSVVIGDLEDAFFIGVVLFLNAGIGAYQEWNAEQSSLALRKLLRIHAVVERGGEIREIPAEEVVPGDRLLLESGNRVAADLRLVASQGLQIDESLLTGESAAVEKDAHWLGGTDTPLADCRNMAYAGSLVARGRAVGVVVATGAATEVGQLALAIQSGSGGRPPLLERMERFTNFVALGTLFASLLIGGLGMVIGHYSLLQTFFLVVALAVSAIPEGLPVAMTVALSVAALRMARRNVIVRRLAAVEGLGSCTLIATDKTGTLTCNELTVRSVWLPGAKSFEVTGEGFAPRGEVRAAGRAVTSQERAQLEELARAVVLCNEAELLQHDDDWTWRGDAVDVALLVFAAKLGVRPGDALARLPLAARLPYEPDRQFAATFHSPADGQTQTFVKGAMERVLQMCGSLDDSARSELEEAALALAGNGLRVLAVASGALEHPPDPHEPPTPANLRFLGFVGLLDPLRAGVRDAVAACRQAGVQVAMITGDHRATGLAIARELGLADRDDEVLTAAELDGLSPDELAAATRQVRVFARVTPRQKLDIVQAAQRSGHFVAVTGDGVNDAPALQAANIGVAMGKSGTDVAREAAELVLGDDNFVSIVAGIEEGRVAYDNIRKVIYLLVSMGAAELLMVLLAVASGLPIPLLPVQLLWLNLVTDGILGIAMGFEPGEGDALRRQPRPPNEPIFNRLMRQRMLIAVLLTGGGGFAVFYVAKQFLNWTDAEARNLLLLCMVLCENFHVGNCRSETRSAFAFSPLRSPMLFAGVVGALLVHLAGMYVPFLQEVLQTQPVSWRLWAVALGVSVLIVPAVDLHKWWWNRRPRQSA